MSGQRVEFPIQLVGRPPHQLWALAHQLSPLSNKCFEILLAFGSRMIVVHNTINIERFTEFGNVKLRLCHSHCKVWHFASPSFFKKLHPWASWPGEKGSFSYPWCQFQYENDQILAWMSQCWIWKYLFGLEKTFLYLRRFKSGLSGPLYYAIDDLSLAWEGPSLNCNNVVTFQNS